MLCLGRILQHPDSNEAWKNRIAGVQSGRSYRDYDGINGESTEFEWNIFPGFTTLQLCGKINDLLSDLGQTPETFTGRILFMSMFNDMSCDRKGNKDECLANAGVVKVLARRFGVGQWSFIGPGSEKKWYSAENSPQGAWDNIAEEMLLEFAEGGHPTFRATTPLSRGILKSKGHGKLWIHFAADEYTIETIFRVVLPAVLPLARFRHRGRKWADAVSKISPLWSSDKSAQIKNPGRLLQLCETTCGLSRTHLSHRCVRDLGKTSLNHGESVGP